MRLFMGHLKDQIGDNIGPGMICCGKVCQHTVCIVSRGHS